MAIGGSMAKTMIFSTTPTAADAMTPIWFTITVIIRKEIFTSASCRAIGAPRAVIFPAMPPFSLTSFLLLAFSLNPDPGNRREALKKCPDIVTERSSKTFVSVYWSGLLILENTIFYSVLYVKPDFDWLDTLWWLPALALNIWLTKRHVTPALEIMLDYEKLYFPIRE